MKKNTWYQLILFLLCTSCSWQGTLLAQGTIPTANINVRDSNSNPLPNALVEVAIPNGNGPFPSYEYRVADQNGVVTFSNATEGSYIFRIAPYEDPNNAGNYLFSTSIILEFSLTKTHSGVMNQGIMATNTTDHLLRVKTTEGIMPWPEQGDPDPTGAPVPNLKIFFTDAAITVNPAPLFIFPLTDSNGEALLPLQGDPPPGTEIGLRWSQTEDHTGTIMLYKLLSDSGIEEVIAKSLPREVPVTFDMLDTDNNSFALPEGFAANFLCSQKRTPHFVTGGITIPLDSVSMKLPRGNQRCEISFSELGQTNTITKSHLSELLEFEIPSDVNSIDPVKAVMVPRTAPVEFKTRIIKSDRSIVDFNPDEYDTCVSYSTAIPTDSQEKKLHDYGAYCGIDGSSYTVNLLADTNYTMLSYLVEKGTKTLVPSEESGIKGLSYRKEFETGAENQPVQVNFDYVELDSEISVTVPELPEGKYLVRFIHNPTRDGDETSVIDEALHYSGQGPEPKPVYGNTKYLVNVFPLASDNSEDEIYSTLTAPDEFHYVPAGQRLNLTINVPEPDYTLTIEPEFYDPEGNKLEGSTISRFGCSAESKTAALAGVGKLTTGIDTLEIPLKTDGSAHVFKISCQGFYKPLDIFQTGAAYYGKIEFKNQPKQTASRIKMVLKQQETLYPESSNVLTLADGDEFVYSDEITTVNIPQAITGSTTGSALVKVNNSSSHWISDKNYPVVTYEVDLQVDDKSVDNFERPITFQRPFDAAAFETQHGFSPDPNSFRAKYWDSSRNIWRDGGKVTYSPETQQLTLQVTKRSVWGIISDISEGIKKQAPRQESLKSKVVKNGNPNGRKKPVILRWDRLRPDVEDSYTLQILKRKTKRLKKAIKQGKDKWSVAKEKTVVGETKTRLQLAPGSYSWRLKVFGGSVYTSPRKLRVK